MTPRHPAVRLAAATSFGAVAALVIGPAPAYSHALETSLERLSSLTDQWELDSRFGNGEPAEDAVVRLVPPGGSPIDVGRTDAHGQLRFRLPPGATASWEVQVDKGPGHRDYLELPSANPPATTSSRPSGWQPLGITAGLGSLTGWVVVGTLAWRRRRLGQR